MKLVRERQKSYDLTHMRTLRDKTEETHKYEEQTEGYGRGCGRRGWAKWVRGTKESTPEIIVALYAN